MGTMRLLRLILFYTILFTLTFLMATYLLSSTSSSVAHEEIISPLLPEESHDTPQVKSFSTEFAQGLQSAVDQALEGSHGRYSVVVTNLANDNTYSYNPERIYQTASLYKLWTMAVVYQEIEAGNLKKDQVLKAGIPELNQAFGIASDEAELSEGEIELTVEVALERMITVSENYPALLLTRKVGISKIAAFLKKEKFAHSNVGQPPKTTARDIAVFYAKLYHHEFTSKESSEEMIDLLKRQRLNDRIPKYLPDSVEVAHKTGELGGVKHDAGIIFTEKGDYVLVLLSESSNQQQAAERLAMMADNIYTFLMSE